MTATMTPPLVVDDVIRACGFSFLTHDSPMESFQACVTKLAAQAIGADPVTRSILREGAIRELRRCKVRSPAAMVDAALDHGRGDGDDRGDVGPVGTMGPGIIDVVMDGKDPVFLTTDGFSPCPWSEGSLPWKPIPTRIMVETATNEGAGAPWADLKEILTTRVVLPEPTTSWASLLAAWVFGTYLLDSFTYWPLLLLEGPPERGKTRLGKALTFPSFRGIFTPSPTPAILFRYRGWHRVTMLLDVEDLPATLDRSDLGELILNSFERDGEVARTTRPDAPPQEQVERWKVYGPTILITNRPIPDHSPLRTRCLRIPMPEAGAVVVPDAVTPDDVVELRARIIAWAASMAGKELPTVDIPFTGRMRDLASPVLRVLGVVAPDEMQPVVELLTDLDRDRRVEASRSWEARVAVALIDARGKVDAGRLYLEDLLPFVNEGFPETDHLTAQNVGTARRNLGLRHGRGGAGGRTYIVWPGDDAAQLLHNRYSPDGSQEPSGSSAPSGSVLAVGQSPLNTLNTLEMVFSPEKPCPTTMSEHPEDPEHPSGPKFSEITVDLFSGDGP